MERLSVMSGTESMAARSSSSKSHWTSKPVVKWRRLPDLPCAMFHPQVVVTPRAVYVGGGVSRHGMLDIYSYDFNRCSWSTLPCNNIMVFGMCMFQDQLVTVGGGTAQGLTNKAFSIDPSSEDQKWEEFPSMNCARMALCVVSGNDTIVALGGAVWVVGKKDPTPVSTVEVYHSRTRQWQQVCDIPYPCASMSTTIMGDVCYLMGDISPDERRKVLCLDLLQYEYSGTPPSQPLDSPTTASTSMTESSSASSPSLSPSPSHTVPGNKAAGQKKATVRDDKQTKGSVTNKKKSATTRMHRFRGIPSIVITSSKCSTASSKQHPSHTSNDNAASAIAPQSRHESNITLATPLSHSPVNAVSSLSSSNTSMPASPSISTSPSPTCSSPSFSTAATPAGHPIGTFSKSMPDLDTLPEVHEMPHHFHSRAAEDWYTLPHPPTENGCILGINNHLVALGGSRNGIMYQAMLIYSKRYDRWLRVAGAEIPTAVEGCSAAVLQTGEILLVGGEDSEGEYSNRVYVGCSV